MLFAITKAIIRRTGTTHLANNRCRLHVCTIYGQFFCGKFLTLELLTSLFKMFYLCYPSNTLNTHTDIENLQHLQN